MQPHDLFPNFFTYSAALSAFDTGQQPHIAMSLLPSMQAHDL